MIELDGALGEGGGQVLRTALGLSLVTGVPVAIERVRANRSPPGLRKQHLAALRAAAAVGAAQVDGAEVGARSVRFAPSAVIAGHHRFAVGSAGSATLVLQTVLPALLRADRPSRLVLEGGTHNPLAPPFDFLERVYLPLVRRLGPRVEARLVRPGFFPRGGGVLEVDVEPAPLDARGFALTEAGRVVRRRAVARVADLPREIAERELAVVRRRLRWPEGSLEVAEHPRCGPGNALALEVELAGGAVEVVSAVGERGRRAEDVARAAVDELEAFLALDVPVGEHLADQLLLLLALAGGGRFRAGPLSLHAETQRAVIARFLPVEIGVAPLRPDAPGGPVEVRVGPAPPAGPA